MASRRLLFLVPFPPRLDGTHGGSRTMAHLLVRLAERHEVAIIALRPPGGPDIDERLQASADLVVEVKTASPRSLSEKAGRRARLRSQLVRGVPLGVTETAAENYAAAVRKISTDWKPDLVQIEFDIMGQFIRSLAESRAPRVLVVHEPGIDAAREGREHGGRLVRRLDVSAWRRFARELLSSVDAVVVFTERDRRSLETVSDDARIATIPPGVELSGPNDPSDEDRCGLLFVGNFIHPPNVDAAHRLASEIFPRVRSRCPEATLHLVGASPPDDVRSLAGDGVIVAGPVPDISPYLRRAAVVVAPVRQGGGMRIKVLEALAAGKATVASPLAVAGLDVADDDVVMVAETDEELASCVLHLLHDPEQRRAMGERARVWAGANLRWEDTVAAYERLYESLLED